ncbi:MAG: exosome complex exonuclease Rrp41 [Nanoarchaeota archaeon]|nr:exosome complex exonuclease Rrp41 [Nanoarchaeota archaeon]MBU4283828.1 exosome complex exonuclease Rrp41 [Nanoarchaeota archaeon]
MSYTKRNDGRKFDETRPVEAKAGVIKRADGSAYFKMGKTVAYAAVYGPREIHPKFLQNPRKGKLRCFYNMMPFSSMGERVRPGANRRAKEIAMVTEKALLPVVDLTESPNSVVDVFIELPQTDAGTRCAGICAASMALADAGIPMKDMVAAVSIGRVDDKLVVDLDYSEESYEDGTVADIPIAVVSRTGEISLLQMDGELSRDELKQALEMAKKACSKIDKIQRDALKKKYEVKNE